MPRITKETEKKKPTTKSSSSKKKPNIEKDVKVEKVKAKKTATKKVAKAKATPKASATKSTAKVNTKKAVTTKKSSTTKSTAKPKSSVKAKAATVTKSKASSSSKVTKTAAGSKTKVAKAKKVVKDKPIEKEKKVTSKKVATKAKSTSKKTTAKSKTASTKKASTKTTKKDSTKTKSSAKKSTKKTVAKEVALKVYSPEYYDLPFKYNKTVVTMLAQTPTNLFIYWEISDDDRKKLKRQYGEYFFEITKPVLIIHNITKNYSFEIDINDFANSWYVKVNDSDCEYKIELGRRPIDINYNYIPQYDIQKQGPIQPVTNPYIYISSSNDLISPNDRVLFNWSDEIYFRNVKTKEVIVKHIKDLSFINKYGEIVSLYELYKKEYGDDFLKNPSSGNSSSLSFSSSFK